MDEEVTVDSSAMDDAAIDAALTADSGTPAEEEGTQEEQITEIQTETAETPETEIDAPELPIETTTEPTREQKLEKQNQDQKEFIQRQAQEVGELRKRLAELSQLQPPPPDEEAMYSDPMLAVRYEFDRREHERQQQDLNNKIQIRENEIAVKEKIPNIESMIDDIAGLLKEDGYDADVVRAFKANPFQFRDSQQLLMSYARVAEQDKKLKTALAEIETLKKKPDEMLKKIETAAKSGTTITAGTGTSGSQSLDLSKVHLLSDTALDELLKS